MKIVFVSTVFWLTHISCFVFAQSNTALAPADFQQQTAQRNTQILDVRTQAEYDAGHISRAMLADWNDRTQFQYRVQYLDKSKPVYVYCLSGGRSAAAARWMRENGFTSVLELQGGISAWKSAALPLEGIAPEKQWSLQDYLLQIGRKGLVLASFQTEWCPPCRKMQPIVAELQKEMGDQLQLIKIDGAVQSSLMKSLKLESFPSFIVYRDGEEQWRKEGMVSLEEFKKALGK